MNLVRLYLWLFQILEQSAKPEVISVTSEE
jgi:hypothetical protein